MKSARVARGPRRPQEKSGLGQGEVNFQGAQDGTGPVGVMLAQ